MLCPSGHVAVSPVIWSYLGMARPHLRDVNESVWRGQREWCLLFLGFSGEFHQSPPKSLSSLSYTVPTEDSPSLKWRSFCLGVWKTTSSVNKIIRDVRISEWPCISKLPQSLWKCSMTLGTWYTDPYLCHGNNVHIAPECGQSLCSGLLLSPSSMIKWVSDFHKTWLSPSKHPLHLIALLRNED